MKSYEIEKNVEKIRNYDSTGFLNRSIYNKVKERLRKDEYLEYLPFTDSDKIILYNPYIEKPKIKLYKIKCKNELKHSSILGNLFSLNIEDYVFGDIVKYEDSWYVYLLDTIADYVINNIYMIDNCSVCFEEVDIDYLSNYSREYDVIELIVSSLRIDNVISKLIGTNRDNVKFMLDNKDILVNYDNKKKPTYLLREDDIFSIRRYGKYIYKEILGKTKKDNYIIQIYKYK